MTDQYSDPMDIDDEDAEEEVDLLVLYGGNPREASDDDDSDYSSTSSSLGDSMEMALTYADDMREFDLMTGHLRWGENQDPAPLSHIMWHRAGRARALRGVIWWEHCVPKVTPYVPFKELAGRYLQGTLSGHLYVRMARIIRKSSANLFEPTLRSIIDFGVIAQKPRHCWLLHNLIRFDTKQLWCHGYGNDRRVHAHLIDCAVDGGLPEALYSKAIFEYGLDLWGEGITELGHKRHKRQLERAAQAGSVFAHLSLCIKHRDGVPNAYPVNPAKFDEHATAAAELGSTRAARALTQAYALGRNGLEMDEAKAAHWLKVAVEDHRCDLTQLKGALLTLSNLPKSLLVPFGRWTPAPRDFYWLPEAIQNEVLWTMILCKRKGIVPYLRLYICQFVVTYDLRTPYDALAENPLRAFDE